MPPAADQLQHLALKHDAAWVWNGTADKPHHFPHQNPHRLLTPAFTNFHTHLELSDVPRPKTPGTFTQWLGTVMRAGPPDAPAAAAAALRGAHASLSYGVARVIDITRFPAATRAALAATPLRVTSCGEITGLAGRVEKGQPLLTAAATSTTSPNITPGLSPHAPYSTDARWYRAAADLARKEHLTLTTHLAETPEERQFLASHTGIFRDMWNAIGDWTTTVPTFPNGPIRWLEHLGVLHGTNVVAAHVNDVTDAELHLLAQHNVTVVHCPRTHAYFNRPPFNLPRYQAAGLTVKLGTDSTASAGNLNLLEDLQLLATQNPTLPPHALLQMARDETPSPDTHCIWPTNSLNALLTTPDLSPVEVWIANTRVL